MSILGQQLRYKIRSLRLHFLDNLADVFLRILPKCFVAARDDIDLLAKRKANRSKLHGYDAGAHKRDMFRNLIE